MRVERTTTIVSLGLLAMALWAPVSSASEGCAVVGRVGDASGAPVDGAMVVAWPRAVSRSNAEYEPPSGRTDTAGFFRIEGVPAGSVSILVEARGRPPLAIRGRPAPCKPGGEGRATDLGELRLPQGAEVAGRVVDGEGRPVAGVAIELLTPWRRLGWFPGPHLGDVLAQGRTESDGRFRMEGVGVGSEIRLRLRPEGYVLALFDFSPLAAAGSDVGDLVLERAGAIHLSVIDERTGAPVPAAGVEVDRVGEERIGGGVMIRPETDERGVVLLDGLSPGKYRISAWATGMSLIDEARVVVRVGETAKATVRLTSYPGGSVEVSLLGGGISLEGAEVALEQIDREPYYAESKTLRANEKSVRFEGVPFGRYHLRTGHDRIPEGPRREVDIGPETDRLELVFEEPEGGWVPVFGRVIDDLGRPVRGAEVYFSGEWRGGGSYEAVSDEAGEFAIEAVAVGRYSGEAYVGRYGTRVAELEFEVGPPRTGGLVVTLPRGVAVKGRVLGLRSEELALVEIEAVFETETIYRNAFGFVEADGTYWVEGLTPGNWSIVASLGGRGAVEALSVDDGVDPQAGPDLAFTEGHRIAGTVLYQGRPYSGVEVVVFSEMDAFSHDLVEEARATVDGTFRLGPVSTGTYRVLINDPAWGRVHSELLEVSSDVERTWSLAAARLSGQVVDATTKRPVPDAWVHFGQIDATYQASHSRPSSADLEDEARFEIGPLEEGRWKLTAEAVGYVQSEVVVDVRGEDFEDVVIELTPTPGLDLVVRTEAGEIPEDVDLRLDHIETCTAVAQTILRPAGGAEAHWADAPPGQWKLVAWDSTGACTRLPVSIPGPPVEVVLPVLAMLEVSVPELHGEGTGAILRLYDEDGQPVSSRACATPGRSEWPGIVIGRFYAHGLQPGTYEVRVSAADGRTWSETVALEAGIDNRLTLTN